MINCGELIGSLVFARLMLQLLSHSSGVEAQSVDYCDWETFNATCPAGQVISIISARYGRMRLATKCVSLNYGNIGCGADVTSHLEATCSGNRACALSVISLSQISLPTNAPCPSDLKYYLEAEYECLKVYGLTNVSVPSCPAVQPGAVAAPVPVWLTDTSEGLLSSSVATETGLGGPSCPWMIRVEPHQRINITLLDFSVQSPQQHHQLMQQHGSGSSRATGIHGGHLYRASSTGWQYGAEDPSGTTNQGLWPSGFGCDEYALILEDVDLLSGTAGFGNGGGTGSVRRRNATVCGRRRRHAVVYISETNIVQVRLNLSTSRHYKFVLKYEAFGCAPFVAPPGAWATTTGHNVYVRCNDTSGSDESLTEWRMTCRGTSWHSDHVGNCSGSGAPSSLQVSSFDKTDGDWAINDMFGNSAGFPFGILFVIVLGVLIGVVAGVLMLLTVLAYMRRRKLRKVRSRSNYVLHDTETTTGSGHSYDAYAKTRNANDAFGSHGRPTPIYRPFLQDSNGEDCEIGTWQRTRPLPVPTRLYRIDNRSRASCDELGREGDDDDENVIAMTPLTSTSEHPLLTPTIDSDAGLFNITSATSCGAPSCDSDSAPDAVRNFIVASSTYAPNQPQQLLQQPMDAGRLLMCPEVAVSSCGTGAGYERCLGLRDRSSPMQAPHSGNGPYYFKLDLTAGLGGTSDEPMTGSSTSQCLVCRHQQHQQQQQQQQQRGGTLHRHQVHDQCARGATCPIQQLSVEQRY